ncbi:hypothetical protein Tco_0857471 [Tanacetum coccineum]|uniref:Uncharacterized protein n=1 Tax=Tanacetum coccineum TaxID=301880 RepID=A0ABQ5B874_9ASTR
MGQHEGSVTGRCSRRRFGVLLTNIHDAQKDRATVRAEIEVLRRERLAYVQESMEIRQAFARSEAYCRALEARVTVLETECASAAPRLADGIDLLVLSSHAVWNLLSYVALMLYKPTKYYGLLPASRL